jgi:DNA polymerase I-like protein with 3'-5' exonuclease and polymerase domains
MSLTSTLELEQPASLQTTLEAGSSPIVTPNLTVCAPPLKLATPLNVKLVTNYAGLCEVESFLKTCDVFGWDIETTPVKDFFYRRCRTIQVGNTERQYVIDLLAFCDNDPKVLYEEQGYYGENVNKLGPVVEFLAPFLTSEQYVKVGINLGFEYHMMYWLFGMRTCKFFDCSIVERSIWAGLHSLKDYDFYSLEEMFGRYFKMQIDKSLQTSFNLEDQLSCAQVEYAALDTRLPIGIMKYQQMIVSGKDHQAIQKLGFPRQIIGDNLEVICQIENDAIGVFQDMHVHGERLDTDKWLANDKKNQQALRALIDDELDAFFLPIVGDKNENITEQDILDAEAAWKKLNEVSDAELDLKPLIRQARKAKDFELLSQLEKQRDDVEAQRKLAKQPLKDHHAALRRKRTAIAKLAGSCEGQALINYSSDDQLKKVLKEQYPKHLGDLETLDDEILEAFETKIPVMGMIRRYHGLSKLVGTYGAQWAQTWTTHPCKEEGWLNPGDGRLHCQFNQMEAETGRSSSSQPNAQNLPKDKEVRSCFIADPGHKLLTIDMSGAELRILAEEANDPIWIGAFARDEDVHSVCTEMVEPEKWPKLALPDCAYYKPRTDNGMPQRQKCKCPEHNEMRDGMKPTNFGLPYGIGPKTLSLQIGKTYQQTLKLMQKHKQAFPSIWAYLERSGKQALEIWKSFDMFGRRRLFKEPTWETACAKVKEDREKDLRLDDATQAKNLQAFEVKMKRKPTAEETWFLTHREPNGGEIGKMLNSMRGYIERQGKNHRIQSCNATIIKLAMGSGRDANGEPYLWWTLPKYNARVVKMVHDELVIQVPEAYAQEVAELVQSAFRRAAATKMTKVVMKSDYNIADYWKK